MMPLEPKYSVGDIVQEREIGAIPRNHYMILAVTHYPELANGTHGWYEYSIVNLDDGTNSVTDTLYFDNDTHKVA